jgi:hypothetical protein
VKLKHVASIKDRAGGGKYKRWDSEVSQFLKKIFKPSLLPPAEVSDCIALDFIANHLNEKRVEEFCDYLLENYIDADSTFPPPVWSECFASSLRTINACEPFHAHFNALFYSAHPNIFVLVSSLQNTQNETCIEMRRVTIRKDLKTSYSQKGDFISSQTGKDRICFISVVQISTKHTLVVPYCLH